MGPILMPPGPLQDHPFHRRPGERFPNSCLRCGRTPEHHPGEAERHANLTRDDGRPMATCETATGLYFDFDNPQPDQFTLEDVAHHLSRKDRFAGATSRPYSVAEHAVRVSWRVEEMGHPELCLAALHHDSHEFMLGDWPTPLKRRLREAAATVLDEIREAADVAIAMHFGICAGDFDHPVVKEADVWMLYREAATFLPSRGVGVHWGRTEPAPALSDDAGWPWDYAKYRFIKRHWEVPWV